MCHSYFLQLYLLGQKKMMIHSGRHLCWTISIPHNIPIWICSHPISMLSIYLTTWRQVCQSHFEFSPSLTKSFNPSGNHRLGQYVFASEYFDLHISSFWKHFPLQNLRFEEYETVIPNQKEREHFSRLLQNNYLGHWTSPPAPFKCPHCVLKALSWNRTNENPSTHKLSRQSTTPSPLQKIGSQGSAANNQTIKCRKLWKIRWATNNVHPLK